jgi:hypothetical protein
VLSALLPLLLPLLLLYMLLYMLLLFLLLLLLLTLLLLFLLLLLSLHPQHLPGLQQRQRDFLVQQLGSAKQRSAQQEMEHLGQLVLEQQDAEEVAL